MRKSRHRLEINSDCGLHLPFFVGLKFLVLLPSQITGYSSYLVFPAIRLRPRGAVDRDSGARRGAAALPGRAARRGRARAPLPVRAAAHQPDPRRVLLEGFQ